MHGLTPDVIILKTELSLPARGMVVEDPTAKHGLKLTIKDYPFANDGLILRDAIKQWVSDCVDLYYPETSMVESDKELNHGGPRLGLKAMKTRMNHGGLS
ncbi:hypothetical protein POTOM_001772 [Populus tomentosa]|uniref:Lipoxygenase domain-containing protein n=1 Tax=Populus tomentosa TaxID=118781 RepID=A0A8X8DIJ0_POPTO|nr:hypothetical protein POTOM_001772 [Populus tomentosa]